MRIKNMSKYKQLIDEAMKTASYRLSAGVDKTASAPQQSSIVKEASELANALEYMSIAAVNDGSVAGMARAEMVRDFYKSATSQRLGTKLAGSVGESSTSVTGQQGLAVSSGKTKLTGSTNGLMVTSSPDSTGNPLKESFKQANTGKTLYDILMHQKEAGDVGEMDASMPAPGIPSSNENSNRSLLNDASILSGVSKYEAKAPVRDRLREAFATASDTTGEQSAKAIFPMAYQKGGLKKTAYADGYVGKPIYELDDMALRRRAAMSDDNALLAGGLGALAGGAAGALTMAPAGAGPAVAGGLGGAAIGGALGYGGNKLDQYLVERELRNRAARGLSLEKEAANNRKSHTSKSGVRQFGVRRQTAAEIQAENLKRKRDLRKSGRDAFPLALRKSIEGVYDPTGKADMVRKAGERKGKIVKQLPALINKEPTSTQLVKSTSQNGKQLPALSNNRSNEAQRPKYNEFTARSIIDPQGDKMRETAQEYRNKDVKQVGQTVPSQGVSSKAPSKASAAVSAGGAKAKSTKLKTMAALAALAAGAGGGYAYHNRERDKSGKK